MGEAGTLAEITPFPTFFLFPVLLPPLLFSLLLGGLLWWISYTQIFGSGSASGRNWPKICSFYPQDHEGNVTCAGPPRWVWATQRNQEDVLWLQGTNKTLQFWNTSPFFRYCPCRARAREGAWGRPKGTAQRRMLGSNWRIRLHEVQSEVHDEGRRQAWAGKTVPLRLRLEPTVF